MTLPLAWDLRGSSTGAARPPRFPYRRAMSSQQQAQAGRRRSPNAFPACPASPSSHWRKAAGQRLKPRAKMCHQTQQLQERSLCRWMSPSPLSRYTVTAGCQGYRLLSVPLAPLQPSVSQFSSLSRHKPNPDGTSALFSWDDHTGAWWG